MDTEKEEVDVWRIGWDIYRKGRKVYLLDHSCFPDSWYSLGMLCDGSFVRVWKCNKRWQFSADQKGISCA